MSAAEYPPVCDLIPHAGDMVLLDGVIDHSRAQTRCRVVIGADSPYHHQGIVPPWIGIEYLAQTIAVHGGLHGRAVGDPIRLGLLVGCRHLTIATSGFRCGQVLEASVERLWGEHDLFAFRCALTDQRDGSILVHGTFVVARPPDE
jgi:predicted hotdog family 3-hydroxylacyl-ACP dehydratase